MNVPTTRLTDLDELVQTVRDPISRDYVREAINAYLGGANRAAIVALWAAVVYDIVGKTRELSLLGDPQAVQMIQLIDAAIARNDVGRFLQIESGVLKQTYDAFEFIDHQQFTDLERLQQDRHRCAHPAFTGDDTLFQPSPGLVRAHVVHAVSSLLQHQPVQGKSALTRMMSDILSPTFPRDLAIACEFLEWKYLNRAKEALIRNATLLVVKTLLYDDDITDQSQYATQNLLHTLRALSRRHPRIYETVMKERLADIAGSLSDDRLLRVYPLVGTDPRSWDWMNRPTQFRLQEFLRGYDFAHIHGDAVFWALAIDDLVAAFIEGLRELEPSKRASVLSTSPRAELGMLAVETFHEARSFREAERIGTSLILPMIPFFSATDITALLSAVQENSQIWHASGMPQIMVRLYDATQALMDSTSDIWLNLLAFLDRKWIGDMYITLFNRFGMKPRSPYDDDIET